MSDRRMNVPADVDPDRPRRAELMWYVRKPTSQIVTMTVHLISEAEYRLIRANGLDPLLDLFDEHDYPPIFYPNHPSYA